MSAISTRRVAPVAGDDRIYPETRAVAAVVIFVLVLAFVVLFLFPAETPKHFAWNIKPLLTPMLMGAGYAAGAYFFLRVLTARRWHTVAAGFLPITLFTVYMLLATFMHWDRFIRANIAFPLWTGIYMVTPFLVPIIWWRNRPADPGTVDADDTLFALRVRQILLIVGATGVALSALAFIFPQVLIDLAPWTLTPLTARVGAGWMALGSATIAASGADGRWSAARTLVEAATTGAMLMLLAIIRGWSDLRPANPLAWLLLLGMAGSFIGMGALLLIMRRRPA